MCNQPYLVPTHQQGSIAIVTFATVGDSWGGRWACCDDHRKVSNCLRLYIVCRDLLIGEQFVMESATTPMPVPSTTTSKSSTSLDASANTILSPRLRRLSKSARLYSPSRPSGAHILRHQHSIIRASGIQRLLDGAKQAAYYLRGRGGGQKKVKRSNFLGRQDNLGVGGGPEQRSMTTRQTQLSSLLVTFFRFSE